LLQRQVILVARLAPGSNPIHPTHKKVF